MYECSPSPQVLLCSIRIHSTTSLKSSRPFFLPGKKRQLFIWEEKQKKKTTEKRPSVCMACLLATSFSQSDAEPQLWPEENLIYRASQWYPELLFSCRSRVWSVSVLVCSIPLALLIYSSIVELSNLLVLGNVRVWVTLFIYFRKTFLQAELFKNYKNNFSILFSIFCSVDGPMEL